MKIDTDVMDDMMKVDESASDQQAGFTRMQDGSLDDWKIIGAAHKQDFSKTADRFIAMLRQLEDATLGFACDQLQHALMCGTLARRDGATTEQIVIALCHDIAKVINVPNHGPIAAEMMRPYISEDSYNVIYNHQAFQGEHYYHYLGEPTDLRKQWKDESWYPLAVKLVDEWDAPAFDPDFEVDPLESFIPLMREVFHDAPRPLLTSEFLRDIRPQNSNVKSYKAVSSTDNLTSHFVPTLDFR